MESSTVNSSCKVFESGILSVIGDDLGDLRAHNHTATLTDCVAAVEQEIRWPRRLGAAKYFAGARP